MIKRGLAVTWFAPNKADFIRARIWNNSLEAPAGNRLVSLFFLNSESGDGQEIHRPTLLPDLPVSR